MAAKVSKLDEQFKQDAPREKQKEGAGSEIFRGVAIYVNGYTDPTADELRRLMMLHGGQFHVYYSRSKTTHIIATNLPNNKIQELRTEKVVRPEWITDSIKAGRLLSCLQYQLYRPKGLCFPSTWAPQGLEPAGPSHTQNNACHAHRVMDHTHRDGSIRLNGSTKNCVDWTGGPKMNGVHEGDSEYPEQPLTNGHAHPANGALKPLDLALRPGRDTLVKPRPPPSDCPQTPPPQDGRPATQPRPLQTLSSLGPPSPNPASHNKRTTQTPPRPSANQKASIITRPCLQTPPPQSPTSEKPLPQCGRVRMNGAHYASPAPPTGPVPPSGPAPADSPGKHVAPPTNASAISEYYSHSRLHHISTWRNEFSEFVNSLQQRRRAKGGAVFPGRERLRRQRPANTAGSSGSAGHQKGQPCILHVDMDCFFASVGIRHRPDLKGLLPWTSNRGPGTVTPRPGANPQLELLYYQRRRERKDGDLDTSSSPESPDAPGNGVDPALVALSMAEIASCSYEARYRSCHLPVIPPLPLKQAHIITAL
ncbi:hypothetical protein SKAU_G00254530 [Synaphobranchus kaupii]|uniref:DNA repair protein REV1 n=1 Tax=Synaphobranchus kaupii TaxID=118154 RepID=A0A9Q1F3H1_SYNKA|nr:hypothetical protein SKAU_G00254530 [Synaphobranchus kaupii]